MNMRKTFQDQLVREDRDYDFWFGYSSDTLTKLCVAFNVQFPIFIFYVSSVEFQSNIYKFSPISKLYSNLLVFTSFLRYHQRLVLTIRA